MHPEALKQKNLDFFRVHFPQVYELCSQVPLTTYNLSINPEADLIDFTLDNQSLYEGDARAYCEKEAEDFLATFEAGRVVKTTAPPMRGEISFVRFFSKRMNALINSVPEHIPLNNWNIIPDFLPMVVFLGSGLGIHIEKVMSQRTVLNAVIFEPDSERFLASLYVTDWDALLQPVIDSGRKVEIMVATTDNLSREAIAGHLWNELIRYTPSFPLACFFLNHRREHRFEHAVDTIKKDMHFFLNQWGYYDDEINQMNNALHNLFAGVPPLQSGLQAKIPMAVIGGGPSLDKRIEEIRERADNMLIISAGTAIHSILRKGIVPDIHVEIESHMLTYDHLSKIDNPEFFDKTLLVGALQLPPNVFEMFSNRAYFVKDSTALAELFAGKDDIIYRATPTCTNTGAALAAHVKSPDIHFYGMDFGFPSKEEHHAKDSIYYKDELSDAIRKELEQTFDNIITTEAVGGGEIFTISMYNTSRRSIEHLVERMRFQYEGTAWNCSGGAKIKGADYLTDVEFLKRSESFPIINKDAILQEFIGKPYAEAEIRERIAETHKYLKRSSREVLAFINGINPGNLESLFKTCHKVNRHITDTHAPRYGSLTYLTRGSLWHWMNCGASVALSYSDTEQRTEYLQRWKEAISLYLKDVADHFLSVTSKDYPDPDDPWIKEDIVGNEALYHE